MRHRDTILSNLEKVYRDAYDRAREAENDDRMESLDFRFQRDQLLLEALLDVRRLLATLPEEGEEAEEEASLLEKAQALRNITRLR